MSRWRKVPLGELVLPASNWISIEPDTMYRQVTARLWGKGLTLRAIVRGSDIAARSQNRVSAGQLLISKIDARHGAFGLVPKELDGAVVSSDFPTFTVNEEHVLPGFLRWVVSTDWFVELCRKASEGSTNRVRLKEGRFLSQTIPLPPLNEQCRIVARLEKVSARIEQVQRMYSDDIEQIWQLCRTIIRSAKDRGGSIALAGDLMSRRALDVTVEPEITYDFAGVYSFGRGVFRGDSKRGADFSYTQLTQLRDGDFVYPKLMAWEGALGVVPPECDGCVVSPEFPVFEIDRGRISPAIVDTFFRDPETWRALRDGSKGTNLRRRRINPDQFLMLKVPVPSKADRVLLDELIPKATKATNLVVEASSELDQLLPSLLHQTFR